MKKKTLFIRKKSLTFFGDNNKYLFMKETIATSLKQILLSDKKKHMFVNKTTISFVMKTSTSFG